MKPAEQYTRFHDHPAQGDQALPAHLDPDPAAFGDHHVPVLRDFRPLIGSRIGEMGGFTYMQFVVPGLIMMAIVTNSYSNVVSSFFGSKFNHSVEELLVSPTPNYVILMGYVVGWCIPRPAGGDRGDPGVPVLYRAAHPQLFRRGGWWC